MDIKKRLMQKCIQGERTECWNWTGSIGDGGYGRIYVPGEGARGAHRVSFRHFKNLGLPLPDGRKFPVCHTCDNPSCINPEHLYLGTPQKNMDDKVNRGRARGAHKGSKHHMAKLSEDDVRAIRERYDAGGVTQKTLSEEYGVARSSIARVVGARDRFWTHVK